jgi:hypothetical protein
MPMQVTYSDLLVKLIKFVKFVKFVKLVKFVEFVELHWSVGNRLFF